MRPAPPIARPDGPVLVLAPHFDDEVLGCGALLAGLEDKARARVAFACDGRGSADLPRPAGGPDPGPIREAESRAALALLGIPPEAVSLLDLPDGTLSERAGDLRGALERVVAEAAPRWILAPFRFDRHPDHIALARAALALAPVREGRARLLEYFVYTRWRLFPKRDIRRVVKPGRLLRAEPGHEFAKRRALDGFKTQTTCWLPGQDRPVLTETLLREVSAEPELFLDAGAALPDRDVLAWPPWLVRLITTVEARLKRAKDARRIRRRLARRNTP